MLLEGDPAIRWQVMHDLLDAPAEEWEQSERGRSRPAGSPNCLVIKGATAIGPTVERIDMDAALAGRVWLT